MRFVLRRLGFFVVTLWAAITVNFVIPRLMPGNPAEAMMSRYHGHINPQALHALEVAFGVKTHQSLLSEYFDYLGNVFRGRFGTSLTFFPDPVMHNILQALPWTLVLVGVTTIVGFVLGTLIGLIGAWRRGGFLDGALPPIFIITSAFPYFWLAILSIWLFSLKLGWLPQSGGYDVIDTPSWTWHFAHDAFVHSILPALTILVTAIGGWILTMRNNTITVLTEDYVRMARAKGLKERLVVLRHVLRNSLIPVVTLVALGVPAVFGGAIVTEQIFRVPGIGELLVRSIGQGDTPVVAAILLIFATLVVLFNVLADVLYGVLDPRIRYS